MDRFSSREDVEFNKVALDQGAECRMLGFDYEGAKRNNPFDKSGCENPWLYKSFVAGWADADQSLAALKAGKDGSNV